MINVNRPTVTSFLSPAVNGNQYLLAPSILEKYNVGKVIGDGNFAVVKECVERYDSNTGRIKSDSGLP